MSDVLSAALDLTARGYSVLPIWPPDGTGGCACPLGMTCKSPGKHPIAMLPDGRQLAMHGLGDASSDPAVVQAWWAAYPAASVGLALARSGLVAIDADFYKQDDAKIRALEAVYGSLPDTSAQMSGSGQGAHLLYVAPPFPIRGEITAPGLPGSLTLRGKNYLVVAPSPHPSGNRYTWMTAPWECPVAELPLAWLEAVRRPVSAGSAGVPPEAEEPDWLRAMGSETRLARARAHLERERGEVKGLSRSGECFNVCRTTVRGHAIRDPEAALALVLGVYNPRCVPRYEDHEIARRVVAAYDEAVEPEWGSLLMPEELARAEALAAIGLTPAPPTSTPAPDLRAELAAAIGAADEAADPKELFAVEMLRALDEVAAALGKAEEASVPAPLFERATSLFGRQYPSTPWLVRGLITQGGVGAIATEPKSAKTWLATELALAVASGTKACGEFETGAPRRVAYFYAEDLGEQVRNKLRALCAARGVDPAVACAHLNVQPRGRNLDLTKVADIALLVASCRLLGGIDLLVLDPLRDIHSAEEDSSDGMAVVMRGLRVIAVLLGCTVLFVHHSAKATGDTSKRRGGQRMRGSSAIHGAVDFGIYLRDLQGDGESTFSNTAESEVKGARAAGVFSITITIEDDATGAAVRATWAIDRSGANEAKAKTDEADEQLVLERVRVLQAQNQMVSKTEIRDVCAPLSKKRAEDAASRLLGRGALIFADGSFLNKHGTLTRKTVIALPGYSAPSPFGPPPPPSGPDPALAAVVANARPL